MFAIKQRSWERGAKITMTGDTHIESIAGVSLHELHFSWKAEPTWFLMFHFFSFSFPVQECVCVLKGAICRVEGRIWGKMGVEHHKLSGCIVLWALCTHALLPQ